MSSEIKLTEIDTVVGKYMVVWRNDCKAAVRVTKIDEKGGRVHYEVVSGPDSGVRYSSSYDPSQKADVWDEEEKHLACLNLET